VSGAKDVVRESLRGVIAVHAKGFGFVSDESGSDRARSAFVPPPMLNAFLQDDVVDADVDVDAFGKRTAVAVRLVHRPREALLGRLLTRNAKRFLRVDRAVANTDWPIDDAADLKDDAIVVAAIVGDRCRALRTVSDKDADSESLLLRHRLRGAQSDDVEAAVAAAPAIKDLIARELPRRRDLRDLVVVTIDGPSTKDIDDALACGPADDDGGYSVVVAIADVDAVVEAGGVVDVDAFARGTSVYLPDRVIPMLPRALSEDRLSLVEGEDRLCLCAELRVDADGCVTAVDVYEGVMRSTARLTYDAVAEFLDKGDDNAVPAGVKETLLRLRAVAARLSVQRAARGGVAVDRAEARLSFDDAGRPVGVVEAVTTSAHLLVERLMVAANEGVAAFLVARGLPGVYRVHDAPDLAATQALRAGAHELGVEAGFSMKKPLSPLALAAFDAQITGTSVEPAARTLLRRLLDPARYQTTPSMHFGLAAPLYLHFTSPIRRYADLVVHRVLKRFLRGERADSFDAAARAALDAAAAAVDDAARRAARAESERTKSLVAQSYAGRIGERVRARVVGQKPFGLLVQLPGIVALLPDLTEGDAALGSAVDVEVVAVDVALGRIEARRV
jgi:ribonuclease R